MTTLATRPVSGWYFHGVANQEAFEKIYELRQMTTYYDLMGAEDYVEEFKKALFLPHTDIEQFRMIQRRNIG